MRINPRCLLAIIPGLLNLVLVGCSDPDGAQNENVKTARELLQKSKTQEALGVLSSDELLAEEHYLKAVALDGLGRVQPAMGEIEKALRQSPESVKYQGLKLRLRLFQKEVDAADELIRLQESNPSSAAVSLFSVYAYQAKAVQYVARRKPRAAEAHRQHAIEALKTSIELADEVPEFQHEILAFALQYKLGSEAKKLVDKLLSIDPENAKLVDDKIAAMLMLEEFDDAAQIARSLYQKKNRNESAAEFYAQVMVKCGKAARHDRAFRDLTNQHPRNSEIVLQRGLYLARTGRLVQATDVVQKGIEKQRRLGPRSNLISAIITIPIEAGFVALAEEKLEHFRDQISDRQLVTFYEGRILYLQKRYGEALEKMASIVEAQRWEVGGSRSLASEALKWIRQIQSDEMINLQLQKAASGAVGIGKPEDVVTQPDADQTDSSEPRQDQSPRSTGSAASSGKSRT